MKLKVLACAALLAASALTLKAQSNVYSLNVVGYINLPLVEGFNMVANQLDADGTGTNNTVAGVFSSNLPLNSKVYTWDPVGATYNIASYVAGKSGNAWSKDFSLNPGQGAWVSIPSGAFGGTGKTQTVTTVGTVLQGNLSNPYVVAAGGFGIVSSQIPLAGGLQTTLGYVPQVGEKCYAWDPIGLTYVISSYVTGKSGNSWSPSEPQISVGEGFWYKYVAGATWKTNFTVGP